MDVAVTEFRTNLRHWLERASDGAEIVVTDRGVPVARVLGIDAGAALRRLADDGTISRPARDVRPAARNRARPRARRPVADRVAEQRR